MFHIFFCCERVGSIKFYSCCAGCVVLVKTCENDTVGEWETRGLQVCTHKANKIWSAESHLYVGRLRGDKGRSCRAPSNMSVDWFWLVLMGNKLRISNNTTWWLFWSTRFFFIFFYSHTIIYASLIAIITIININFSTITGIISISISITWNIL